MADPIESGAGTAGGAQYSPQPGLGDHTTQTPVQETAPVQQPVSVPGFVESVDAYGSPVTIDQYGNVVQYEADGTPVTYDAQGTPYYYDAYGNPWPNGIAPAPAPAPAPEPAPSAPAEDQVTAPVESVTGGSQTSSWSIPGFVTTTDENGVSITTDQYGNIVETDENGQAVTYDANGIPYYYDAYGNPWPYGDPGLLDQYQPSTGETAQPDQSGSWTPEVTEPEVDQPVYDQQPAAPEVSDPYAQYAELNAAIVQAALPLVGTTNGWQCAEVAAAALAGAGVYDADSYWPDEFADVYGVYVDTPQAGNLIYYDNGGRGVDHIAVYIGDGQAVHGNYYIDGESYTVIAGAELEHAGTPQYIQVLR